MELPAEELLPPGFSHKAEQNWSGHYLRGEEGAVQFLVSTFESGRSYGELGFHSPRQLYSYMEPMPCGLVGEMCYYDGSSGGGDRMIEVFREGGLDAVKEELMKYYRRVFLERE